MLLECNLTGLVVPHSIFKHSPQISVFLFTLCNVLEGSVSQLSCLCTILYLDIKF